MSSSACIDRRRKAFWPPGATETPAARTAPSRSEEHTSELQSPCNLVCRLLLEKKKHQKLRDHLRWRRALEWNANRGRRDVRVERQVDVHPSRSLLRHPAELAATRDRHPRRTPA